MTVCSLDALDAHEPLAGTAPYATAWIVIEQPGPWGRDALADSRVDPGLAAHLSTSKGTGVSVLLARHPDRPDRSQTATRHVWVARSVPGGLLMRHAEVASLDELEGWDLSAIGQGSLPPFGVVTREPVTFVCTHSGRDRCCAVHGRALVNDLMRRVPATDRSRLWECSHIGGHRFAPVSLTLPLGAVHGRLDVDSALTVFENAVTGRVVLDRVRGRTGLVPPHQVAAIEVQRRWGIEDADALDVLPVTNDVARSVRPPASTPDVATTVEAEVRHVDGRAWRAVLAQVPLERDRLESCGKDPVPGTLWTCVDVVDFTPWR